MKTLKNLILLFTLSIVTGLVNAQCTSADPAAYGSANVWIGYVYQGKDFNALKGTVTEGNASDPAFDRNFGGNQVNYATSGCTVYTDTFSVRYRLTKSFASGQYTFTAGGDDGYRFSIDGGSTWVINNWGDHGYASSSYTVTLNGTYNLVVEYYENFGDNRVSFSVATDCVVSEDHTIYGTGNIWKGHIYQGANFLNYKGSISEGSAGSANFDENFNGSHVTNATASCNYYTENFSARFLLTKNFDPGTYTITVGGDDGFRLSLDGGTTWVINAWNDQSYTTRSYSGPITGSTNMVLEYYENGGDNRVSINISAPAALLPVTLLDFTGKTLNTGTSLSWKTANAVNFDRFAVQRSLNGVDFTDIAVVKYTATQSSTQSFAYTDIFSTGKTIYYRLAMIDKDGTADYSKIISFNISANAAAKIYPTLVQDGKVYIDTQKPVQHAQIEVYDMNGRLMMMQSAGLSGHQQILLKSINGSAMPKGSYVLRVSENGAVVAKTIVQVF